MPPPAPYAHNAWQRGTRGKMVRSACRQPPTLCPCVHRCRSIAAATLSGMQGYGAVRPGTARAPSAHTAAVAPGGVRRRRSRPPWRRSAQPVARPAHRHGQLAGVGWSSAVAGGPRGSSPGGACLAAQSRAKTRRGHGDADGHARTRVGARLTSGRHAAVSVWPRVVRGTPTWARGWRGTSRDRSLHGEGRAGVSAAGGPNHRRHAPGLVRHAMCPGATAIGAGRARCS